MFWNSQKSPQPMETGKSPLQNSDFGYLKSTDHYFDTACQTLRPQSVIDAEIEYYTEANACGGRSAYPWAQRVDQRVEEVRLGFLTLLNLSPKEYLAFFGLNTTHGIHQILWGLDWSQYDRIVTTDIEHNSVFLPVMKMAQVHDKERIILERNRSGDVIFEPNQLQKAVVILNTTSNIDGRVLGNREKFITEVHKHGGIVILDACQTMGHNPQELSGTQADVILMSGHKMYGPSLGIGIARRSLVESIDPLLVGGGTVSAVSRDGYQLLAGDNLAQRLEPGLQNWSAIWAMKETIDFLESADWERETRFANQVHDILQTSGGTVLSGRDSSVQTFYFPKLESSLVGNLLAKKGVMVRTGYFCCHYYLTEKNPTPHLVRLSVGQHTTEGDIQALREAMKGILKLT